jgi:hypothetical protein
MVRKGGGKGGTERKLCIYVSFPLLGALFHTPFLPFLLSTGLIFSMTMDGCLPSFLLTRNAWRGTDHFIILSYLLLAVSQVRERREQGREKREGKGRRARRLTIRGFPSV